LCTTKIIRVQKLSPFSKFLNHQKYLSTIVFNFLKFNTTKIPKSSKVLDYKNSQLSQIQYHQNYQEYKNSQLPKLSNVLEKKKSQLSQNSYFISEKSSSNYFAVASNPKH